MLQKFFATGITMACFLAGNAQDATTTTTPAEEKKSTTTFTGSADVYYRYDFSKPVAAGGNGYNSLTSFTKSQNTFRLGMASLKVEHKTGKVGVVADLGFGTRAEEFAYNDEGTLLAAVKQLYISYSATDWLKITAGSWATHVGYELVDPQLNRNYSMSYMFTNGPFTHTGLKAEITKGKHGFMIGVANPTDYRIVPEESHNKKTVIAQYSLAATDNVKFYLNYVGGKAPDSSKSNQVDLVATAKVNDKFSLGFNGTYNSTKLYDPVTKKNLDAKAWWGSALYLNLDPKPWFGLTLRGEYFNDDDQLKVFGGAPKGGTVFAGTLSANFKVDGFTFIPEFRLDNASEEVFFDKDLKGKKSIASLTFAMIYSF